MKKYTSHILTALAVSSFCLTLAAHTVSIASAEPSSTVANAPEDAFHKQFRKQIYEAYPPVSATAKELKTSGYNQFENPTGIVFEEGDTIQVIAGAWADTVGVIQTINPQKQSLTINVELFGRETPVEIGFAEVKKM